MSINRMVLLPEVWKSQTDVVTKVFDLSPWAQLRPVAFEPIEVTDIVALDGSITLTNVSVVNNILLQMTISGGTFAKSNVSFTVGGYRVGFNVVIRDGAGEIPLPPIDVPDQPIFIVPEGGEAGQVLAKGSDADGDLVWAPNGDISSFTPGDIGGLAITARLSEFETEEAKQAARVNLGVHIVDGGTFF